MNIRVLKQDSLVKGTKLITCLQSMRVTNMKFINSHSKLENRGLF